MRDIILYGCLSFTAVLLGYHFFTQEEVEQKIENQQTGILYTEAFNPPSPASTMNIAVGSFLSENFISLDKQEVNLTKQLDQKNEKLILIFSSRDCIRCYEAIFKEIARSIKNEELSPAQLSILGVFDNPRHMKSILRDQHLLEFANIYRIKEKVLSHFAFLQNSPLLLSLDEKNQLVKLIPIDKSDLLVSVDLIRTFPSKFQ